jgi:drug/metabolite transporter (DMT)-like permease
MVLAFTLVYLSWGTTYYAIHQGVHEYRLPPALFGGVRVCLAGCLVLGFLRWRGVPVTLPAADFRTAVMAGFLLFVGGNGFINVALDLMPSGETAVLVATTPLWVGFLEVCWPKGERLNARGWLGLIAGLGGVLLVLAPKVETPVHFVQNIGPLLVLASAFSWSLGSLVLRHRRRTGSHLAAAAYQMVVGGGALTMIGLAMGEAQQLTPERITWGGAISFLYLLVVGSLVGFVAFNWLLGHVSAPLVGTYAYVNPVVAILVGWLLGQEELTGWILGGLVVILASVALVRGSRRNAQASENSEEIFTSAKEPRKRAIPMSQISRS